MRAGQLMKTNAKHHAKTMDRVEERPFGSSRHQTIDFKVDEDQRKGQQSDDVEHIDVRGGKECDR